MEKLFEKKLNSEEIYKGKVFNVTHDEVELCNGYKSFRDVVHHNGGVVIVAENDNKILMVQQYRYATNEEILSRGRSYSFLPGDITRYVENLFMKVRLG